MFAQVHYINLDDVEFDATTGTILNYTGPTDNTGIAEIPQTFEVNGENVEVKHIGNGAFFEKAFHSIWLPSSIITIGDYAFEGCGIDHIPFPDNITSIGDYAFSGNILQQIWLPNKLTSIGESAFRLNFMREVSLPNSLISIGDHAFEDNELTSVDIPENVNSIGDFAFNGNLISSVDFPDSYFSIGKGAFNRNQISEINGIHSNGIIYPRNSDGSEDYSRIVCYGGTAHIIDFIPNTVETIGSHAFMGNDLTSIDLPGQLKSIGAYAFHYNSISSINLPNNLTTIGEGAFYSNSLESITIPKNVTSIGAGAFNNNSITEINNQPTDGIIYSRKNDGTEDSSRIVSYGGVAKNIDFIPEKVTSIERKAFMYSHLTSIDFPGKLTQIGAKAFISSDLISADLPENLIFIDDSAFYTAIEYGYSPLKFPIHPEYSESGWIDSKGNTYQGGETITDYYKSYSIHGAYTITYITDGGETPEDTPAFYHTSEGITSLVGAIRSGYEFKGWINEDGNFINSIPAGTEGDIQLFAEWDYSLTINDLDFDSNSGTITGFKNTSEKSIVIPDSFMINGEKIPVKSIDDRAFAQMSLTSVKLPETLETIGVRAFADNSLKSVTFSNPSLKSATPKNLTSIGTCAFMSNFIS